MKRQLFSRALIVKQSPIHGYGVFANEDIERGEIIEEAYTIPVSESDLSVHNFCYVGTKKVPLFLPFGNGCIYNHHSRPNAGYKFDARNAILIFQARRKIHKGQEIFIDYGESWFKDRGIKARKPSNYVALDAKSVLALMFRFTLVASAVVLAATISMRYL